MGRRLEAPQVGFSNRAGLISVQRGAARDAAKNLEGI
jgi:hypothetical protein